MRYIRRLLFIEYKEGTNKRDKLAGSVFTVGSEPSHAHVAAHNEMSYFYYDEYPGYFIIGCVSVLSSGAESLIGNNIAITHELLSTKIGINDTV